ncbi:MAG TPA: FAD-dependent oxidoreductase [Thermoleophilaceae bacterium]|nr:FAD-dependent oxidoreductase [Thermoleophilaceae bacterium]
MSTDRLRAAVVGAGPAGLTTLVALTRAGIDATCFEKADRPGGLWAYGAPLSGAYRSLHLNTSKARTELAGFPMPAEWPDFPSHERIGEYFQRYVDESGVRERARFGAAVERAEHHPGGGWAVSAEDGFEDEFDALVVASGHNWEPRLPDPPYPGSFDGTQIHAHDYREPDLLDGRKVLVVGMGNSAMDIAVESSTVAERTFLSTRRGTRIVPKYVFGKPADQVTSPTMARLHWRLRQPITHALLRAAVGRPQSYGLPAPEAGFLRSHPTISDAVLSRLTHGEIAPKPGVQSLDGDGVRFADGTREEIDTIVWCTGYRVTVPYVDESVLGAPPGELPLFKRMFHHELDDVFFIGLVQTTGSAIPVVERQSALLADHLTGRYALPAKPRRRNDARRRRRAAAKRYGERGRPHLRVEFDGFMRELELEHRRGRRRAERNGARA